ncbi:MAG: hypothetical protein IKD50_01715 [Clostridia bacterium]|nr:hypothetical protein [Clostridia bacterium]
MTNLEKIVSGLGGLMVTQPREVKGEILKMIACPFEAVEDPDALEIEGCPSEAQCAECKGCWLQQQAEG